ncbi:MAG: nicotinate phosphoribosyltransferase [Kineosporiaceae bacterium]
MATPPSTALLTDHYELTMLDAALRSGAAHRRSVFEVFARRLPPGRRYGVVAGMGRLLDALAAFRFDDAVLGHLDSRGVVSAATLDWLAGYRFTGHVWGHVDGEVWAPGSPLLVVEGSFAEAVLLETLSLSVLNHDCAIAAAASRMVTAAAGRPLIEMGSRRTHEGAAVAAALAAYVAGFASTSNLEAGRRHGVPTAGTSAHAFTLLHDDEPHAFAAQVAALGPGTTLLVDTYDVPRGITAAVQAAGSRLGAVRLDSGDLIALAHSAREQLDSLGARDTRIVVTGDLDEHAIAALAATPADGYGVGTSLVTGSGAPTAGLVYKLVARSRRPGDDEPVEPVAKASTGKPTFGGRKAAARRYGATGTAVEDVLTVLAPGAPSEPGLSGSPGDGLRPLLVPFVRAGERVWHETPEGSRRHHARVLAELPPQAHQLSPGDVAVPTVWGH